MKKAKFIVAALAATSALMVTGTAGATAYGLVGWYQRSSGGVLSNLMFRAGVNQGCPNVKATPAAAAPTGYKAPCYRTTGGSSFMVDFLSTNNLIAQVSAAAPTWDWNTGTKTLTESGLFWATSAISSSPAGTPVISDKVHNLVITVTSPGVGTVSAADYTCIEGTFLITVGANGCENINLGVNNTGPPNFTLINDSVATWNVGGNSNCVQLTINPDDFSLLDGQGPPDAGPPPYVAGTPNPRGLFTANASGGCNKVSGAFATWYIVQDNANYLILADVPTIAQTGGPTLHTDPNDANTPFDPNSPPGDGCYLFGQTGVSACIVDQSLASISYLVLSPDTDGDGIGDAVDNCKTVANGTHTAGIELYQRDTNDDGYGNACDADINNDGTINGSDYLKLKSKIGSADPDTDLNGDGTVNGSDYLKLKAKIGSPPGPSGLPCAAAIAPLATGTCVAW